MLISTGASAEIIPYKNSGNPWIDNGPIFFDTDDPYDSRTEIQVWKADYISKQVMYWNRFVFKKEHWENLVKNQPSMVNPYPNLRKPLLHHVDCTTLKVHYLQFSLGRDLPLSRTPDEDSLEGGKLACKTAGIPTPNEAID